MDWLARDQEGRLLTAVVAGSLIELTVILVDSRCVNWDTFIVLKENTSSFSQIYHHIRCVMMWPDQKSVKILYAIRRPV